MAASKIAPLPSPVLPWVDQQGRPTIAFQQFMTLLASGNLGPLVSAANDADAAKAGVQVGFLYQNAGAVRIRLS